MKGGKRFLGRTHESNTTYKGECQQETNNIYIVLTSLGSGGEERDFDFFLPQFVGQFDDRVPGTLADCLSVIIQVIEKMNFASGIDCNLVTGTDAKTGVITRTKVHDALAGSRISLLVKSTLDGQAVCDGRLECIGIDDLE